MVTLVLILVILTLVFNKYAASVRASVYGSDGTDDTEAEEEEDDRGVAESVPERRRTAEQRRLRVDHDDGKQKQQRHDQPRRPEGEGGRAFQEEGGG